MLSKNILNTIIYYNILDFPLTSFELWKYLTVAERSATEEDKCAPGGVFEALENREIRKHVEEFRGFYFLKGRKELVGQRIQNDKISVAKYKIAERVSRWLRFVPFVRMIAVTGTLAMKNPEKESDIDFFVVLEKGRIWTGRLLVTLAVHLLGRRRYGKKIKNRICLNYFITTGSLEIKRQDLFAANEYSFIYPIFGWSTFQNFSKANSGWIRKYKPNFEYGDLKPSKYFVEVKPLQRRMQRFFGRLINLFWGDRIELWLKRKQIERIKKNPLTYKKGGYVEYTDENLIFLPEPQGPKVLERFKVLTSDKYFL